MPTIYCLTPDKTLDKKEAGATFEKIIPTYAQEGTFNFSLQAEYTLKA